MIIDDAFQKVIEDSYDERNKMREPNRTMSIERLVVFAVNTDESFKIFNSVQHIRESCIKLFDRIKSQRPGYVYQDLENIIYLGYAGIMKNDKDKDEIAGPGHYEKWFERYGIERTILNAENQRETRRNQWLRTASKKMFIEQNT